MNPDIINATPTIWRDMTPEEKGALLLAHHEGKVIEHYGKTHGKWFTSQPVWNFNLAYRIKPQPKVDVVTIYGNKNQWEADTVQSPADTHRITFNTIDGKPDPASIKMTAL